MSVANDVSNNTQVVILDRLRLLAFGSVTSSYQPIGTGFTHPVRIVCLTNSTDADMFFSIDGVNNYLLIPAGSFKLFDLTTNRFNRDQMFVFQTGTTFYVKQASSPSKGNVTVEALG